MVNIDNWFPNFELFVLQILPALVLLTFAVIFVAYWMNRQKRKEKTPMDWMDVFKWGTAIYMVVPIYRIIGYVNGTVGFGDLVEGLFVTDFYNYMILALITGIMGLMFILRSKMHSWRGVNH